MKVHRAKLSPGRGVSEAAEDSKWYSVNWVQERKKAGACLLVTPIL